MKTKLLVLSIALLNGTSTYAFYSEEEILKEFENKKMGISSLDSLHRAPASVAQFYLPTVNEIIPEHLQDRQLSKTTKSAPDFGDVKPSVDLRHRDAEVVQQIGPRCSAYGLVATMENLLGEPSHANLSRNHLWSFYKVYSSESAIYAAKRNKITEEVFWPHDEKYPSDGWSEHATTELTHATYIDNDVVKAVKALDQGRAVYLGASVTKSWGNCDVVMDPNSQDTGGGHAVAIVGYKLDPRVSGGGYFIIKNSWGSDCGDHGYQYFPFNYCQRGNGSYCIMWDVQGIQTAIQGVQSVIPEDEAFNLNKIEVDISSSRRWYQMKRRVNLHVGGESIHARKIDFVEVSIDGGSPIMVDMDIDEADYTFKSKNKSHQFKLIFHLKDGRKIAKTANWTR